MHSGLSIYIPQSYSLVLGHKLSPGGSIVLREKPFNWDFDL